MAVQFSSLLKKQKKLKKGVKTALTQLQGEQSELTGLKEDKGSAIKLLKESKSTELGAFRKQIGSWDVGTGTGTGLMGELGTAGLTYNTAATGYEGAETAFSGTKSGKAMASFKEKYKTYDPTAAKDMSDFISGKMKESQAYKNYQAFMPTRSQADSALKELGFNPQLFSAYKEGDNWKFEGDQKAFDMMSSLDKKFGKDQLSLPELLVSEATYKNYLDKNYESPMRDAMSEFTDQSALAYGPRNVRRAGPTEYQQYLDKSSGFKSTMETQGKIISDKQTEIGDYEEGTGVWGEYKTTESSWDTKIGEVSSDWDTSIGTQEKEISEIYKPAHTGAKTALTALTARIKKYELLGLGEQEPKKNPTYRKPQMGYGAGYLRRSA